MSRSFDRFCVSVLQGQSTAATEFEPTGQGDPPSNHFAPSSHTTGNGLALRMGSEDNPPRVRALDTAQSGTDKSTVRPLLLNDLRAGPAGSSLQ